MNGINDPTTNWSEPSETKHGWKFKIYVVTEKRSLSVGRFYLICPKGVSQVNVPIWEASEFYLTSKSSSILLQESTIVLCKCPRGYQTTNNALRFVHDDHSCGSSCRYNREKNRQIIKWEWYITFTCTGTVQVASFNVTERDLPPLYVQPRSFDQGIIQPQWVHWTCKERQPGYCSTTVGPLQTCR